MAPRAPSLALAVLAAQLLTPATVSLAQDSCEKVFVDPDTGHPTTIDVLIEQPARGTELRKFSPDCASSIEVAGVASAVGIPPRFDFYVVIDRSGSTDDDSGVDVDGDGLLGGPGDSIRAAEVRATREFVAAIDMSLHRVALVEFSDVASLVLGLTSDRAAIDHGLDQIAMASGGSTNFGAPMEVALDHFTAMHDPTRSQAILFLSDGEPNVVWS